MNLFSCTMAHSHTLHWAYVPGWIRRFRDVGWDDEDFTNGLQEVQISRPGIFSCIAGQRRRCTGQNLAQWKNWRTGFGTLSPTSHTTSAEDCGFQTQSFEEDGGCRRCLHWILSYGSIFRFIKGTFKNYFRYLCIGNIEVMSISECLLTSHPPCI